MINIDTVWLIVGFVAQAFFSARFIVQWIASERARRSVIPGTFWLFSARFCAVTTTVSMPVSCAGAALAEPSDAANAGPAHAASATTSHAIADSNSAFRSL